MEKVYLQYWEESERGWGVRPDGCSLHLDEASHSNYVREAYKNRDKNIIPNEYDKVVGGIIPVKVKLDLYDMIVMDNTIRLSQNQLNNLIKLGELIL